MRHGGLPVDPWLRVHARLGGRIVAVAPTSMTIPGTLDQWREWTGLPFDTAEQDKQVADAGRATYLKAPDVHPLGGWVGPR